MTSREMTVQERVSNVRAALGKMQGQLALALPRHMTPERMARVAMTAIQKTPALQECTTYSLIGAIVEASQLGLEPDGVLGHAYLVPFRNKKTGNKECQLIPGYKGLIDLARRSGQLSTIYAHIVRERDDFDFAYGLEPILRHRPTDSPDAGRIIAVYAVAKLRDGGVQFDVMWKREVEAIRKRSKASNDGPWVTDYDEMAKKTVLRRLCKMLPASVEMHRAVALDERADAGVSQEFSLPMLEEPAGTASKAEQVAARYATSPHEPAEEAVGQAAASHPAPEGEATTTEADIAVEYEAALNDCEKIGDIDDVAAKAKADDRLTDLSREALERVAQDRRALIRSKRGAK